MAADTKAGVRIVSDRVFAPVRYIAESLGGKVDWNALYCDAELEFEDTGVNKKYVSALYDRDRLFWLARIIYAESGGEPFEGQTAVGHVILNRVKSPKYPDTVWGVIFDEQYSVQFEPVLNGTVYNEPTNISIAAAKTGRTTSRSPQRRCARARNTTEPT